MLEFYLCIIRACLHPTVGIVKYVLHVSFEWLLAIE